MKRNGLDSVLLALALACSASPARGYEPQKHVEYSLDALSLYKTCTGRFVSGRVAEAFAEGAKKEDLPTPARGWNWHFYDRDGAVGARWCWLIRCNGSNAKIFARRTQRLEATIGWELARPVAKRDEEEIFRAAGRVAHHLQDMSSPPHVLPIYHATRDAFDKYAPAFVSRLDGAELCDLVRSPATPAALLEGAAQETLKVAAAPVRFADGGGIEGETWGRFWGGRDEGRAGFSTYGDYGNTFGVVEGVGARARYDRTTFDRFFDAQRRHAVIDTARLLIHVDRLLYPDRGPLEPAASAPTAAASPTERTGYFSE